MANLDIITVCYNSSRFILNLIESINATIKNDYRIVIVDNGSNDDNKSALADISSRQNALIMYRQQADVSPKYAPSRHHGEALQHAVSNLPQENIGLVVDCDSYFFMKNWDETVLNYLYDFNHVSCKRPGVKYGCGAWFSAFKIKTIIDNEVSFLPILKPNGTDCYRPNLYDVGSDLGRIYPWKEVHRHETMRYHNHGHVWMIDGKPFLDHMGGSRCVDDFENWRLWLKSNWK